MAWVLLAALLSVGCTDQGTEVFPADASIMTPTPLGERGPFGVLRLERRVRVRVDATEQVEVLVPIDQAGEPLTRAPAVVFIHGGLVGADRYRWLTEHIASRGFVVVAPAHVLDLAFFEQGNGVDALAAVRALSASGDPVLGGAITEDDSVFIGHSLGGVVAARAWLEQPEEVTHAILLSSEPAPADDLTEREGLPGRVLTLTGSDDGLQPPEDAKRGADQLAESGAPVTFAIVEGMNHFQLTEDPQPSELERDNEPSVTEEVARSRTLFLVDALLDEFVTRNVDVLEDPTMWPDGVQTYEAWSMGGAQ